MTLAPICNTCNDRLKKLVGECPFSCEKMNRSELRLFKLEQEVIASKKFQKMLNHFGFKEPRSIPVRYNKRLTRYWGQWGPRVIELSYADFKRSKQSVKTIKSKLLELLLYSVQADNKNQSYKDIAAYLHLPGYEGVKYKYTCQCGHTLNAIDVRHIWRCTNCHKTNVTSAEYNKLKRIAKLKSRICPVKIEEYQLFAQITKR